MANRKIAFVWDVKLQKECDRLPAVIKRASFVKDLIDSYRLLDSNNITVIEAVLASEDQLSSFHLKQYTDALQQINNVNQNLANDTHVDFGLEYDCPPLPRSYDLIKIIAGASVTGAECLCAKTHNIAINWCGGWHHAQSIRAEGFCYVNDIVIAINHLLKTFSKILYLDFDVHHGDAVEQAFGLNKNVMTVSFHKYSPGFYPGTGSLDDLGCEGGEYYSINIPFKEGYSDKTFLRCFLAIFPQIMKCFKPEAIVVQCGTDCLNGDPIGQANLTLDSLCKSVETILNCELPTLFLGGGGYNYPNVARCWTRLTSVIADVEIDNDIPDTSRGFTWYTPTYEISIDQGTQKDCNNKEYVDHMIETILGYLEKLTS